VYSTPPDSITGCVQIDWPAPYQWKSKLEHGRGRIGPYAWMGSLIEGGRDLTGQLYMRNRFYDPQSGRFTQEDPIGIAGGLNVYGFAGGDP
jgi:RHS repeat-associated protein